MTFSFSEQATSSINPSDVMVVILGGGQGSRLYPLTKGRAKPAVNFGGKYRIVDIPITNCLNSQLNRIFILTQFNSFSLNRHIWQAYSREVSRDGFIDVIAAEQTITSNDWFQGTADAVRRSLPYLLYHKPKYILILSGDQVYSMDYNFLFSYHKRHNADVTIAAHYCKPEEISRVGIIKVNKDLRVIDFCEKPKTPDLVKDFKYVNAAAGLSGKPYLSSMGIYLFNTEALQAILEGNEPDFGKEVIPLAAKKMTM
ncbi:MAG: NTP transferase domain-containing protein, partial [bacterium]|nr:NTP transferase domain-containing protein [bacterium]